MRKLVHIIFGILKSIHIQIYAILGGLESYILGPLTGSHRLYVASRVSADKS
jgi:hypothetical protein